MADRIDDELVEKATRIEYEARGYRWESLNDSARVLRRLSMLAGLEAVIPDIEQPLRQKIDCLDENYRELLAERDQEITRLQRELWSTQKGADDGLTRSS